MLGISESGQAFPGLGELGLRGKTPLIVHSGYRALSPVEGGPEAVADAIVAAVGTGGTILVPSFTSQLTDPYSWPVPPSEADRERLMREMPEFDPATTRPFKMGAIAEAFWRRPGARRSTHPVTSWVGVGPSADDLLRDHDLDDPEGLEGPVGRVYRADGWILLLGVSHDANTTIHLAESLLDMPHLRVLPDRYPLRDELGRRQWRVVAKTTKCSDGFVKLTPWLEARHVGTRSHVGRASASLFRSRELVRAVVELLVRTPSALLCDDVDCVHCPTSRSVLRDWRAPAIPRLLP